MAFTQTKLLKSNNQRRGIFDSFIYRTSDTINQVLVAGYFKDSRFLRDDDSGWKGGILSVISETAYTVLRLSDDGLSTIRVNIDTDDFNGGFFDYNDLATQTTPISLVADTPTPLTNDGLGANTIKAFAPNGVTDIWNASANLFDWSQLNIGDMVDIRIDIELISSFNNTEIHIDLELGTGAGTYTIPFISGLDFKDSASHRVTEYNGVYMGDANTLDNGGRFLLTSDKTATVIVNGWYCKIIKRG